MRSSPVGLLLGSLLSLLPLSPTLASTGSSTGGGSGCRPEAHVLPMASGDDEGDVVAMNDQGWAVGYSTNRAGTENPFHTLLWRGPGEPEDLGFGSHVEDDGTEVTGELVDINNDGVVAVQSHRVSPEGHTQASAYLWHDGATTQLPRGRSGNDVTISGLNDHGTAVGTLESSTPDAPSRAVIWKDGSLVRLKTPSMARSTAHEINNRGLVLGTVDRPDRRGPATPWFWRIGGRSGPLPLPEGRVPIAPSSLLDDQDRIVLVVWNRGRVEYYVVNGPQSEPELLEHRRIVAMNDGTVLGLYSTNHAEDQRAWVARLHSERHVLPRPDVEPEDEFPGWDDTYAHAVIRGVTSFAPDGAIIVGGNVADGVGRNWPVIWTCVSMS